MTYWAEPNAGGHRKSVRARLMARLRYWLVPEFTLSEEEEQ